MLLRELAPVLMGIVANNIRVFVAKPETDNEIEELVYRPTVEVVNKDVSLENVLILRCESFKNEPFIGKLRYRDIIELYCGFKVPKLVKQLYNCLN